MSRRARSPPAHLPGRARRRSPATSTTTRTSRTGCSSSTRQPASTATSSRRTGSLGSRSSSSPTTSAAGSSSRPPTESSSSPARRSSTTTRPRPAAPCSPGCCSGCRESTATASSSGGPSRSPGSRTATWSGPPRAVGWLMCGLELHFAPPQEVAIVGPADDPATRGSARRRVRSVRAQCRLRLCRRRRRSGRRGGTAPDGQGTRRRPAGRVRVSVLRVSCAGHGSRCSGGGARRRADPRPLRPMDKRTRQNVLGQWGVREESPRERATGRALQAELEGSVARGTPVAAASAALPPVRRFLRRRARRAASVHAAPARDRAADGDHAAALEARWRELAAECDGDPLAFEERWRAEVGGYDFDDVNRLIETHNRWYPVEARLPMDVRRRDYVLVGGQPYTRRPLDAAWVLERFPARASRGSARVARPL